MGVVECASCGALVNADATRCPDCGDSVAGMAGVATVRTGGKSADMEPWTRRALLYECRNDPGGATTQAYHHAGYVWTFDRKLERERCYRWRARPNDSFERGLPVDERDRREMLAREIEASAAPETGWHHFRFCECRGCSPAKHKSKRQRTLDLLLRLPLYCVFLLGLFLMRPTMPEPGGLVGLVMALGSGAILVLWQRSVREKRRRERQKRRRGPPSPAAPAAAEAECQTEPLKPPDPRPSVPPAPAAAQGIESAPPDAQPTQLSTPTVGEPPTTPEPPEAPQAPSAP